MIKTPSVSNQCIIDCLQNFYDIEIASFTSLLLGADMDAFIYKAEAPDRSVYFVKLKRDHGHNQSVSSLIIDLLYESGIQQIIPIIKTIYGQLTQSIGDFTLTVYPFVEGKDGFSRDLTDNQWETLGKVMRKIHDINVPLVLQEKMRRESYAFTWGDSIRSLYSHIEPQSSNDEFAVKLALFMIEHKVAIHWLIDRAEKLGQQIQNQSPELVLCHSDIHGGNVLIDESDAIYIVDWDAPIMAPKERDLMFIGGGVANVWNQPREEEIFYKSYEKTEINWTIMAYYRHVRILEDIALYGEQLLLTKVEPKTGAVLYKHFVDQFESNGVVEIAFNTSR